MADDWAALAGALRHRRLRQLKYKSRTEFFTEKDVPSSLRRIIQAIENQERTNFDPDTLSRVEDVYGWESGSIERVLRGGKPMLLEDITVSNELPAAASDLRRRVHSLVDAAPDSQLAGIRRHIAEILAQED